MRHNRYFAHAMKPTSSSLRPLSRHFARLLLFSSSQYYRRAARSPVLPCVFSTVRLSSDDAPCAHADKSASLFVASVTLDSRKRQR